MATLLERYNLRYRSDDLLKRFAAACIVAAMDVLSEDPGTANHALRVWWANSALQGPMAMVDRMVWSILSNATIANQGDASSDNDIQFVVNSLIDTYATGVR